MPVVGAWCKVWICFGFVFGWSKAARPRFDTSTDMGLVLVPADAEVDSVIFRLRATDQDADFPLVFEITATITPVVRIENLPCTLYNKVCQANVILTKRLIPGRLHDFAVRVRDTKGDSNSMQATISVTNATTPRDKIFPHIPSLIMVPEDTKPGKELDYLLVRANSWSGKPVYIELWQPKELFTIRQRQTPTQTRGIIILIGELDFETQSMYTLTMYATDPYTEPGKDTRNIAGLNVVVVVQDVQDVPPIFTLAPPLTRINNSVQPGDVILRVHAEDGDKGVPREIAYGLVSEGNPFTPFFNISETTGEIVLARPLEELTQITHVGAPVVLTVVAEEIRRSREEPPAQATVVEVGFLLGEPGNSPPYFESDNYVATIDENLEPGTVIDFGEQFSTRVRDEDIGKAGVFALKLENNNGTFEINPTVAERTADFIVTVRDNSLIDYEQYKSLSFKIIAQEVGPATNLSASAPVIVFLRDVNDNPPVFDEDSYEVTLSENVTAGTRVIQVHATDKDTGSLGNVRYTGITGQGSEAFIMDPDTGLITVAMGSSLDREIAPRLLLSVEARDEDGKGNRGTVPLIVNLLDVNDNAPLFEKSVYEFMLNSELTNFTTPAIIKAIDADAEPPNNEIRYELIHGNYENKFYLNEITGELILRSPITKVRRKKQSTQLAKKNGKEFVKGQTDPQKLTPRTTTVPSTTLKSVKDKGDQDDLVDEVQDGATRRRKRASDDALYTLTARAYDLGVPHLSSVTQIRILSSAGMEARIVMFVVPGEHPDLAKTTETLSTITGGRITVLETRPYVPQNQTDSKPPLPGGSKKSIVVARVEQIESGTALVDIEKIRDSLAANGVGIINGSETMTNVTQSNEGTKPSIGGETIDSGHSTNVNSINNTIIGVHNEEVVSVTVYKAENKLLLWLLIILGLLMLLAIAALIICCICPGCPFYMAPRKRRVHSSETLIVRDGRPKRHLHRKPAAVAMETAWNGRKQAWSADPTRRNWQFNRRNTKNCGLASLPGDVAYISGQPNDIPVNVESLRVRDAAEFDQTRRSMAGEHGRIYVEDVEAQKMRGYDRPELDSLQRHELERGSDMPRQDYRQRPDSRYIEPEMPEGTTVREQHFYREGNAEVLRLVTRGQAEDSTLSHHHRHRQPTTFIVDGKEILLRRFMEDQKSKHDLSLQDLELARSMESHQRAQELLQQQQQQQQQPEVILVPERLDLSHRQHEEEIGPTVQRLVIDHGEYSSPKIEGKQTQIKGTPRRKERYDRAAGELHDRSSMAKDRMQSTNVQSFSFHDLELARQNALLTRLLLEREGRHGVGGVMDTTSYLETQSLPGQVAIATQTDRTTATQTERHVRSRSDNDESDEDSKYRRKFKCKKRYGDGDWKRGPSTLWMKSPIEEEDGPCFDKRLSILRKKVREVKEGRRTSLEPGVLREISDSLDGNGSSYPAEEEESMRTYQRSTEQTSIRYKVLNEGEDGSPSSVEIDKDDYERIFGEKTRGPTSEDRRADVTESTSSQEIRECHEKPARGKSDGKSPRKEGKGKAQRKSDGMTKPSFRILEREITLLTKRLSKLGDKKQLESTDSTSQEKSETAKDPRRDSDQAGYKKQDPSAPRVPVQSTSKSPLAERSGSQRKEAAIAKTRQKLKYQQAQVISTGSSEYEDPFDKPRKQSSSQISQDTRQKQSAAQSKTKRQMQMERREPKRQPASEQESEKRREPPRPEQRPEKPGKPSVRAPKIAAIPRKETTLEDPSTSTSSERTTIGKRTARRDSEKKRSTESPGDNSVVHAKQPETEEHQVSETFSDHFVKEPGRLRQSTTKAAAARTEKQRRDAAADLRKFAEDKVEDQAVDRAKTEKRGANGAASFHRALEQQVKRPDLSGVERNEKTGPPVSNGAEKDENASIVSQATTTKVAELEETFAESYVEKGANGRKSEESEIMDRTVEKGESAGDDSKYDVEEHEKREEEVRVNTVSLDPDIPENEKDEAEASKEESVILKGVQSAGKARMHGTARQLEHEDILLRDVKDESISRRTDAIKNAKVEKELSDVTSDTEGEKSPDKQMQEESRTQLQQEKPTEQSIEKKDDSLEKFEKIHEQPDERKEETGITQEKDKSSERAIGDSEGKEISENIESDEAKISLDEQAEKDTTNLLSRDVTLKPTQLAKEDGLIRKQVSIQEEDEKKRNSPELQFESLEKAESSKNGQEDEKVSPEWSQFVIPTTECKEKTKLSADVEKQGVEKDLATDELKTHEQKDDSQPKIAASEKQTAKADDSFETEKEEPEQSDERLTVGQETIDITHAGKPEAEKVQEDFIQAESVLSDENLQHASTEANEEDKINEAPSLSSTDLPETETLDKKEECKKEELQSHLSENENESTQDLSPAATEAGEEEMKERLKHAKKDSLPGSTKEEDEGKVESIISEGGVKELIAGNDEQYHHEDQKGTSASSEKKEQGTESDTEVGESIKTESKESTNDDESEIDVGTKEDDGMSVSQLQETIVGEAAGGELRKGESESAKIEDGVKAVIENGRGELFGEDSHLSEDPQNDGKRVIESGNDTAEETVSTVESCGKDLSNITKTEITESTSVVTQDEKPSEDSSAVLSKKDTQVESKETTEGPEDVERSESESAVEITTQGEMDKGEPAVDKSDDKILFEEPVKSKRAEWSEEFLKYETARMIEREREQLELSEDCLREGTSEGTERSREEVPEGLLVAPEMQTEDKLERSSAVEGSVESKTSLQAGPSGEEGSAIKSDDNIQGAESLETPAPPKSASTEKEEEPKLELIMSSRAEEPVTVFEPGEQLEPEDKQIELQAAGQLIERRTSPEREDKSQPSAAGRLMKEPSSTRSFSDESVGAMTGEKMEGKFDPTAAVPGERDNQEGFADASVPLYTSVLDTLEDSDESDSSSDISRKTTLTTGPYQTPRHRARSFSGTELAELMGEEAEVKSVDSEEETFAIEPAEDVNGESLGDKEKQEEAGTSDEKDPEAGPTDLKTEAYDDKTSEDPGVGPSVLSGAVKPEKPEKPSSQGKPEETTREEGPSKSTPGLAPASGNGGKSKSDPGKKRERDESKDGKREAAPASKKQSGKSESSKTSGRRAQQPEGPRSPDRKKGTSPDEASDEKSARARDKTQRRITGRSSSDRSKHRDPEETKRRDAAQSKERKKSEIDRMRKSSLTKSKPEKEGRSSNGEKSSPSLTKAGEIDTSKAQPKYMAWYKKKREEMEKKRAESKEGEEQLPRWLQKSLRRSRSGKPERRKEQKTPERTPRVGRKVKPLVNVESEQLKAIVRQGRKLRRAEGGGNEDPPVQIFATTPPAAAADPKHHLLQHSEYKYEKIPPPFYLHPPPVPHPSPQVSPQHFESGETMEQALLEEEFDSGIAIPMQTGGRLRHQQLLEKKSVFDIAYSEAAPPQLRSDSTTPPS